jgi:dipeptidyl aminopeptidase/acylaminoacyl peptidase
MITFSLTTQRKRHMFHHRLITHCALAALLFCGFEGNILPAQGQDSGIEELVFKSSHDGSSQTALVRLPSSYDRETTRPLLVWVQGMYTNARYGIDFIGKSADEKGWLVLAADLRGTRTPGITHLGSPVAVQDLIDAIRMTVDSYAVDPDRLYLVGMSMGGLTGGLVLVHHHELFAAGALLMGISDLKNWFHEKKPYPNINLDIIRECGGNPDQVPEEYAPRSMLTGADRLAKIPLMLCHGRRDGTVAPDQAARLIDRILDHHPEALHVYWFDGDHSEGLIDQRKVLNFLGGFRKDE